MTCFKCSEALNEESLNTGTLDECISCGTEQTAWTFPALYAEIKKGEVGERAIEEDESTCFYHEKRKASVVCDGCGKFLCALCDLEIHNGHFCPNCADTGKATKEKKKDTSTNENSNYLYGTLALILSVFPILLLLTQIMALTICAVYWKKTSSKVSNQKRLMVIASVISVLWIGFWTIVFLEG